MQPDLYVYVDDFISHRYGFFLLKIPIGKINF